LEYIQGQEVSILSEEFEVFAIKAAALCDSAERNIAKYTKRPSWDDDARREGHKYARTMSWIDMETWKKNDSKYRTFGAAIYILAQKGCRDAHDYYFALGGLLGLGQDPGQVSSIIAVDSFQSYLSIAWQALETGDYTPLLLTPHKGEQRDQRAPWLWGHLLRSENLWDLGMCHEKATLEKIIHDGVIKPKLAFVGRIEEFNYCDFRDDSMAPVFQYVASKIVGSSGLCPKAFCGAIDRIFLNCEKKAIYTHWSASGNTNRANDVTTTRKFGSCYFSSHSQIFNL
jgi:hypothetical protein